MRRTLPLNVEVIVWSPLVYPLLEKTMIVLLEFLVGWVEKLYWSSPAFCTHLSLSIDKSWCYLVKFNIYGVFQALYNILHTFLVGFHGKPWHYLSNYFLGKSHQYIVMFSSFKCLQTLYHCLYPLLPDSLENLDTVLKKTFYPWIFTVITLLLHHFLAYL